MRVRKPKSSKCRRTEATRAPAFPAGSDPSSARGEPARSPASSRSTSTSPPDDPIFYAGASLHALFEQQARQMLDRTDLDEEQKQNVLVAMSCPCCGAGAMSFTAKLKR